MASDPQRPARPTDTSDPDAEVGFASAAALAATRRETTRPPVGPVRDADFLFAVYVLILLAVPTFGVAALIGLAAVHRRAAPLDALAAGHLTYQKRTLYGAAAAAAAGLVLILVDLGVFVLFAAMVWTLLRGASGVVRLRTGRPIDDPRTWLI